MATTSRTRPWLLLGRTSAAGARRSGPAERPAARRSGRRIRGRCRPGRAPRRCRARPPGPRPRPGGRGPGTRRCRLPSAGITATGARWPKRPRKVRLVGLVLDHVDLGHREPLPAQLDLVGGPTQADLHERRGGQRGRVEDDARAGAPARVPGPPRDWPSARPAGRRGAPRGPAWRSPGWPARRHSTQMTAWARSSPASARPSPSRALRRMWVTPQPSTTWASRGSGSSSTTTTGTLAQVQLLDRAQPHALSPHTITWPSAPHGGRQAPWPSARAAQLRPRRAHRF